MSDSNFQIAHQQFKFKLKAVDVDWMADCLSDDGTFLFRWTSRLILWTHNLPFFLFLFLCHLTEIDIPADIDIPQDDADVDAGEAEAARKEEQKWTDLDLDVFRT